MKKLIPIILFLFLIFGCDNIIHKDVSLEAIGQKENVIKSDEEHRLIVKVINPTANTFIGKIEYKFDKDCLSINPQPTIEIEVSPRTSQKDGEKTYIADLRYNTYSRNNEECLQRPLSIYVNLYDKSDKLKDTVNSILTIPE